MIFDMFVDAVVIEKLRSQAKSMDGCLLQFYTGHRSLYKWKFSVSRQIAYTKEYIYFRSMQRMHLSVSLLNVVDRGLPC